MARAVLVLIAMAGFASGAAADDGPECFSRYTRTNVCEFARTTQQALAPSLPMRASSNVVIESAVAIGPMVALNVIWTMTRPEFDQLMSTNGIPMENVVHRMEQMAKNAACSAKELSAFVRLGGQIRWSYKTADNSLIHNPTVTACPAL